MRKFMICLAALLTSACGGEVYPVAPLEAYQTLTGVGTTNITPLPGALSEMNVEFEAVPADNAVQWIFSHKGDDIARFIAKVTPEGDTSSNVALHYVEGDAPDENWRNGQARTLIQAQIQRLVIEAIDSQMEKRPFSDDLRRQVVAQVSMSTVGAMFKDANASMDEAIKKRKEAEAESQNSRYISPNAATKPTTNLSTY